MANSSSIVGPSTLQTLIQDSLGDQVTSMLFPRFVLLYLLMRKDGTKQGVFGLGRPMVNGRPNTGIYVAGKKVPAVRKEEIMGAREFRPLIQFQQLTNYGSNLTAWHDSDPAVEAWEDNQMESTMIRPSYHWSVRVDPIEVSLMNMRMTKSAVAGEERRAWAAIGDMWLASANHATDQHCQAINAQINGSSTPTSTDGPTSVTADLWSQQYSIPKIIAAANTSTSLTWDNYAGVDRTLSQNTWFRGLVNNTSQSLNVREMLTYARSTAPIYGPGGVQIGTGLSSFGLYGDAMIMGNDLWPSALAQLDALKGQVIHQGGFPDYPEVGYNRQVAVVDGSVAIINEPNWPAGTVALLSLDTWFCAIHPEANFTVSEPFRQNQVAGGHRSFAATVETQWMYGTTFPSGNVLWGAVTA